MLQILTKSYIQFTLHSTPEGTVELYIRTKVSGNAHLAFSKTPLKYIENP